MKYLITGGCGFIGYHLAKELLKQGNQIVIIDNFNNYYDPAIKRERAALLSDAVIYEEDLLNSEKLKEVFSQNHFDGLIHLAAQPGVRFSHQNKEAYIRNNLEATANLFEISHQYNISNIVFASSSSVYSKNKEPFREDQEIKEEISFYAYTKRENELLAQKYSRERGTNIVVLRFFSVYGDHGRPDLIFNIIPESIINDKLINIYGDGEVKRDFTHVNDIVRAIIISLNYKKGFDIFNIGAGHPVSINELISTFEKNLNKKAKIEYQVRNDLDMDITLADVSKAKNILNWAPEINFENGIRDLSEWHLRKKGL